MLKGLEHVAIVSIAPLSSIQTFAALFCYHHKEQKLINGKMSLEYVFKTGIEVVEAAFPET